MYRANFFDFVGDSGKTKVDFQDWGTNKRGTNAYYCTFENRKGESKPSEVIEIDGRPDSRSQYGNTIIPLVVSSFIIMIVLILVMVVYNTKKKGGTK